MKLSLRIACLFIHSVAMEAAIIIMTSPAKFNVAMVLPINLLFYRWFTVFTYFRKENECPNHNMGSGE